jgi:hypothetical protein
MTRVPKDCREEPGISTQDNDDLVKTLIAAQMVTTWHDSDGERGNTQETEQGHKDSEYNDGEHNEGEHNDGEHNSRQRLVRSIVWKTED